MTIRSLDFPENLVLFLILIQLDPVSPTQNDAAGSLSFIFNSLDDGPFYKKHFCLVARSL